MLAGATAVAVGTANFVNPKSTIEVINGIEQYLRRKEITDVKEIIGNLNAAQFSNYPDI